MGVDACVCIEKTHSVEISLPLFFLLQRFPQNTHLANKECVLPHVFG